ncbi:MAG: 1-acyl-sn-glycerol-3-phosphate acyltransferase [Candidatus Omnitrophica bacterium]|nr:1-acyl-sn-glycerol-3-phosphate acyltransferase [Candidatus Omnitrophota bacterium]
MRKIIRIIFFQLFIRPLLVFFVGVRVSGRENIPLNGSFIIAANHSSHLDTLVLMNLLPVKQLNRIRPVAAADYFMRNPIIYFLSCLFFNIIPIERIKISRGNNPLEVLLAALNRGENLIMFPEGTRCKDLESGEFHSGIAHVAEQLPQVCVVPVYLANMNRALPKGEIFLVPFICEVHIGHPLWLKGTKEEKMKVLKDEILKLKGNAKW